MKLGLASRLVAAFAGALIVAALAIGSSQAAGFILFEGDVKGDEVAGVTFSVKKKKGRYKKVTFPQADFPGFDCPSGFRRLTHETLNKRLRVSRSGRFKGSGKTDLGDRMVFAGRFVNRRRARGTYRITTAATSSIGKCDSGKQRWNASKS